MVQLGLALMVSDEAHNTMRRLQLDLAGACGENPALRLSPHVTLKQPFHAQALPPVEAYVDQLAPTVELPEIHLRGIGFFEEEEEGVAFLDVVPSPPLEEIRRRVLADLADRFGVAPREIEDDRYHFHATLAYHLTAGQLARARVALEGVHPDLRFKPSRLGLFYFTGDLWVVYKLVRLRTATSSPSTEKE